MSKTFISYKIYTLGKGVLQALLLLCTGAKPFRHWYMAYKSTEKSETQYEGILFCVTLLLSLVETVVILYAGLSA